MSLDGTWALEVTAPDGMTYKPTLVLAGGGVSGTVTDPAGAPVAFSGGSSDGARAKFIAKMTSPAPMDLAFDVVASGDQLSGTVASPLGVARLEGRRA